MRKSTSFLMGNAGWIATFAVIANKSDTSKSSTGRLRTRTLHSTRGPETETPLRQQVIYTKTSYGYARFYKDTSGQLKACSKTYNV